MGNVKEGNKEIGNFEKFIDIEKTDLFSDNNIGILFQFNLETRNFVFLNGDHIEGINGSVEDLLKSLIRAQEVVVKEDFFKFKIFIEALRNGNEATVIFRVWNSNGLKNWLKASGLPMVSSENVYYGYIRNITNDVDLINGMLEKDLETQVMIQHEEYPVILVDMKNRSIISCNSSAYRLFEYSFREFNDLKFQDIFQPDQNPTFTQIYETCLIDGKWDGDILLVKRGNRQFEGTINISQLFLRDKSLMKISIYGIGRSIIGAEEEFFADKEGFKLNLLAKMKKKNSINEILDVMLKNQYNSFIFDAVIYIDLRKKKGKRNLFASGDVINQNQLGIPYDYTGLTKEILGNKLDFFIIKDTMKSTNPIDWAFFIPYGIRSYFVKPFFHGAKLTSLLILCSTETNRFTKQETHLYDLYFPTFFKAVKYFSQNEIINPSQ